jgi:SAM-dependent methyltransferase
VTDTPQPFVFDDLGEAKRFAPATVRNRDSIANVLSEILPQTGLVLEIASGTGEHVIHFAREFPNLDWLPSDPDPAALASIAAWRAEVDLPNLRAPVQIDARGADWPVRSADVVLCINMVHIAPWAATKGLIDGTGQVLAVGGAFYLYGPYREAGVPTAPSNEDFDASLRGRDPAWGLRAVEDVVGLAAERGLILEARTEMPANNLSLVFRRV